MIFRRIACVLLASCLFAVPAIGGDWITAPSYFTHDQQGDRVQQYTPIGPFYIENQSNYQRSGYRHTRSSLQGALGIDHYHLVEEWGRPVRPYDEWKFPFRPYSVPYPAWGPPYGGLGGGLGNASVPWAAQPFNGYGYGPRNPNGGPQPNAGQLPNGGLGAPGGLGPNAGPGGNWGNPGYPPWFEDRYPAYDDRAPWRARPFPQVPEKVVP